MYDKNDNNNNNNNNNNNHNNNNNNNNDNDINIIMEYQKIINLLHDITNQPSKFRTRNWVKITDESKRRYDNSNIRFKTSMIRSNGGDYNDTYILVKGTITVPKTAVAPPQ